MKISGDICRQHQQIIYTHIIKSVELFSVVIPACDFLTCVPVIQGIAAAVTLAVVLFGLIKALISRAAAEFLLRCAATVKDVPEMGTVLEMGTLPLYGIWI